MKKSFVIKGQRWIVKYRKVVKDDDGTVCKGLTDKGSRVIYIDSSLPKKEKELVYFHEWTHALMYELHIDLDKTLEELIVDGFSSTVYRMFKITMRNKTISDPYQL